MKKKDVVLLNAASKRWLEALKWYILAHRDLRTVWFK